MTTEQVIGFAAASLCERIKQLYLAIIVPLAALGSMFALSMAIVGEPSPHQLIALGVYALFMAALVALTTPATVRRGIAYPTPPAPPPPAPRARAMDVNELALLSELADRHAIGAAP
jgi:hypothetical protein